MREAMTGRTVLEFPGVVRLDYHADTEAMVVSWTTFSADAELLKRALTEGVQACAANGAKYWVADTLATTGVLPLEVAEFIGAQMVPACVEVGLRGVVTIIPRSALTATSNARWQDEVESNPDALLQVNVASLDEAFEWIRSVAAAA
jgi:hypothetical protein